MIRFLLGAGWVLSVTLAHGQLVARTSRVSGDPNELTHLTIAINPKQRGNILLSTEVNTYYSSDTGRTWRPSVRAGDSTLLRDPSVVCDPHGYYYRFGIPDPNKFTAKSGQPIPGMGYAISKDDGKSWKNVEFVPGGPGKQHMRPRPGTHFEWGFLLLSWTEIQDSGDGTCEANTYFNQTNYDGNRWKDPVRISYRTGTCDADSVMTSAGTVMSTEGRLFTAWTNRESIYFDRSYDNGKTWLSRDMELVRDRKGIMRAVPGVAGNIMVPTLVVDNSASFYRASLYAVWSDADHGDGDIWMLRSTSRGDLWSQPIRVNQDDPGKEQFLPSIAVDELTGILYVVYFDRRAYADSGKTDLYLSYSIDGGSHFKDVKITENPMDTPHESIKSRPVIAAHGGAVVVAWSVVDQQGAGVWTATFKQKDILGKDEPPKLQTVIRKK